MFASIRSISWVLMVGLVLAMATPAHAGDTRIAAVKAARLLEESPQAEAVTQRLKREFSRREQELVAQNDQLKKLSEKRQRDGQIMSDNELKNLERDIISRQRKLKNAREEFQQDLAIRRNEELQKLNKVITEVIIQVAKESGIDMVLEVEVGGVVYADKSMDLTDKVLDRLKSAGN